jgi:CHAT domain-containing protein
MNLRQYLIVHFTRHAPVPPELAHPFFWAPFALIGEGGVTAVRPVHMTMR